MAATDSDGDSGNDDDGHGDGDSDDGYGDDNNDADNDDNADDHDDVQILLQILRHTCAMWVRRPLSLRSAPQPLDARRSSSCGALQPALRVRDLLRRSSACIYVR